MRPAPDPFLRIFRDYLIAEELARDPMETEPDAYPLWLEPMEGAVGPGDRDEPENDDDLVMSAWRRPGFSTARVEGSYFRYDNIEIRMRTRRPTLAYSLEAALRGRELSEPRLHDRRDWIMGAEGAEPEGRIRIIESMVYLELANLGTAPSGEGFTFRLEYSFQRYVDGVA